MKCVINLFDDECIEIVTNIHNSNIIALKQYMDKTNMSSEELIDDLIEGYIKIKKLWFKGVFNEC